MPSVSRASAGMRGAIRPRRDVRNGDNSDNSSRCFVSCPELFTGRSGRSQRCGGRGHAPLCWQAQGAGLGVLGGAGAWGRGLTHPSEGPGEFSSTGPFPVLAISGRLLGPAPLLWVRPKAAASQASVCWSASWGVRGVTVPTSWLW